MSKHHDKKTEKHSNGDEDVKPESKGPDACFEAENGAGVQTEPAAETGTPTEERSADGLAEVEALQAKCRDLQEQYLRKAFDPNLHEAVSMIQSPDVTDALVGEELQKGYKLKERVIRHSKVMVLMPQEKRDEKTAAHDTAADNETNIDA